MADVLLVHVPEDQALAEGMADTLTRSGLAVTLDHTHEAQAACVLVLWSPASVRSGPVRDLAIHAQREGRLVTAKTAGCEAPLGFSKPAPHDLSAWGGDPNDAQLDPMFFAVDRLVCAARLARQNVSTAPAPAPLVRAPVLAFANNAPAQAPAPVQPPAPAPEPAAPTIARAPAPEIVDPAPAPAPVEAPVAAPAAPAAPQRPEPNRSPPPVVAWIAKPRPAPAIDDIPPGPIFREQKPAPAPMVPRPVAPPPAPVAAAPAPAPAPFDDEEDDDWVEPSLEDLAPLTPAKPLPFGLERMAWRPITIVGLIVLCGLTIYKLLPPPSQTQSVAAIETPPVVEDAPTDFYDQDLLPPPATDIPPVVAQAPPPPPAPRATPAPAAPAPAPTPRPEPRRPAPPEAVARAPAPAPAIAFQPPPLAPTTSVVAAPPPVVVAPPPSAAPVVVAAAPPSARPQGQVLWARRANARDLADNYPPTAQDRNIAGSALLDCLVLPSRNLSCAVISESPANQGFGRAAVRLSAKFQATPDTSSGEDAVGKRVRLPVRFQPPSRN